MFGKSKTLAHVKLFEVVDKKCFAQKEVFLEVRMREEKINLFCRLMVIKLQEVN